MKKALYKFLHECSEVGCGKNLAYYYKSNNSVQIPTLLVLECPPGWQSFQRSCYYFGTSSSYYLSRADAASLCKSLHESATLPSIHSVEEDQFLQANTASHPFWLGASGFLWVGEQCLRSMETEREKTWDDHICWDRAALVAIVCKLQL